MCSFLYPQAIRLHLGISTYSFPWAIGVDGYMPAVPLTANELLAFASANEIHHVQFGDNMPLHNFAEEELHALKATADRLSISVESGTRRLTAENIVRYLSIAQTLHSPFLRVVIDDVDFHPDVQQVIETIQALLPPLKAAGIVLAIENHDRFPAAALKHIIEQTDPLYVGVCLDTANSLGANEGTNEVLHALGPYTVNLHIKDITIQRLPHKMGFIVEGCAAGEGILNIPAIVEQLKLYNKCKTATVELWSGPGETIEQSIATEKHRVGKSIHYLKNILS